MEPGPPVNTELVAPLAGPHGETEPVGTIAAAWHTIMLVGVLLGFSFFTSHSEHKFLSAYGHAPLYIISIAWEWLMVGYIALGIRRRGVTLRDLIGGRWRQVEDALIDAGLGVATYIATGIMFYLFARVLGMLGNLDQTLHDSRQKLDFMVPRSGLELALFLALCLTAGICEEIFFRGYLQRQFSAWGRTAVVGIVAQSLLFGSSHGYEGLARMLLIAAEGALLGLVAHWRKSLRPGMFAHSAQDAIAGVALRFFLK